MLKSRGVLAQRDARSTPRVWVRSETDGRGRGSWRLRRLARVSDHTSKRHRSPWYRAFGRHCDCRGVGVERCLCRVCEVCRRLLSVLFPLDRLPLDRLAAPRCHQLVASRCVQALDRAANRQWHRCGECIPRRRLGKPRCKARVLAVALGLGALAVTAALDSGVRRNDLNQPPRTGSVLAPDWRAVGNTSAACRIVTRQRRRDDAIGRNVLDARGPARSWRVAARLFFGTRPSLASLVAQRVRVLCCSCTAVHRVPAEENNGADTEDQDRLSWLDHDLAPSHEAWLQDFRFSCFVLEASRAVCPVLSTPSVLRVQKTLFQILQP